MAGAPWFDAADLFEPGRLRTADIDGTGTTDLLYLGRDRVRFWLNRSGNGFGPPAELAAFPDVDDLSTVEVVDLLGSGTACLVWSSAHPAEAARPLRYVDLSRAVSDWLPETEAAGHKPHLLCQVTNNLGGQIRLVYAPSTRHYLADRAAGQPWLTRLHFPVQVLARMESFDHISRTRLVSGYHYRHGYYDAAEREFRGFGLVEQSDAESVPLFSEAGETELHRPPARTRTWYHVGAAVSFADDYNTTDPLIGDSELPAGLDADEYRLALRALTGLPLRSEVYADDGAPNADVPYAVADQRYRVMLVAPADGDRPAVFRHHLLETLTYHYERDPADPRVKHDLVLEVDEYNVARRAVSIGYPRRTPQLPEQEKLAMLRTVTQVVHATSGAAYRLGVPVETSMFEVTGLTPAGPRFTLAEADQPGAARLVEWVRTGYWNDALTAELPFGQIGTRALIHQTYKIAYWAAEVDGLFGGRVTDQLLAEGGYVQADGAWWIPLRGAAPRPGRVLPAHSGGQPVRQRVQRAVRRLPPAAGVLARVRHRTVRRAGDPGGQRLPAAGPGAHYRPQRQQRQGPLRRPRPGHRDLDPGQGRRGRSRTATGCGVRLPHRERADLVARQPAGAARRRRLPVAAGPRLLRRQRPGRDDQVQGGARPGRPTPLGRHRPGRLRQQGHAG